MAVANRTRAVVATATMAVAGMSAAAALAVPPPPSSHFEGQTNQPRAKYHKVSIDTDTLGHVSEISVGWRAPCRKKGVFWSTETRITGGSNGLPMNGDVFHQEGSYTGHAAKGVTGRITIAMKGHFVDNDNAKGTWQAKVTVKNRKGKVIDKCKVTNIKWKASRAG